MNRYNHPTFAVAFDKVPTLANDGGWTEARIAPRVVKRNVICWWLRLSVPSAPARSMVSKDAVAVDGISLTVAEIERDVVGFTICSASVLFRRENLIVVDQRSFLRLIPTPRCPLIDPARA